MKIMDESEFRKLSIDKMKEVIIQMVNELSDEQAKEVYEEITKLESEE